MDQKYIWKIEQKQKELKMLYFDAYDPTSHCSEKRFSF